MRRSSSSSSKMRRSASGPRTSKLGTLTRYFEKVSTDEPIVVAELPPPSASAPVPEEEPPQPPARADAEADGAAEARAEAGATVAAAAPSAFSVMMRAAKAVGRAAAVPTGNAFSVMMRAAKDVPLLAGRKRGRSFPGQTAGPRRNRRTGWCPPQKRVPGSTIIVDGFAFACAELSAHYILTHFHSDHYGGLTKGFSCGTILVTPITRSLVLEHLRVDPRYLREIPLNTPVPFAGCTVTAVDANHCPGAAIFLIQRADGCTILHTGDFRYDATAMPAAPCLRPFVPGGGARLDVAMLDTTYCAPQHVFPPQAECIAEVVRTVAKGWGDPGTLFVFGTYAVGKERVFVEVGRQFRSRVFVPPSRWRSYKHYPEEERRWMTTNRNGARLWVVTMQDLAAARLRALLATVKPKYGRVVGFRPTGWAYKPGGRLLSTSGVGDVIVHSVPYSEHSSFAELRAFMDDFRPRRVIPTVGGRTATAQRVLLERLGAPRGPGDS